MIQVGKARAIGVEREYRSISRTATLARRSIQGVTRQNQSGPRKGSIAVGRKRIKSRALRETMEVCKPSPINVHGEHRAISRAATSPRRPIQCVACNNQTVRKGSVAV